MIARIAVEGLIYAIDKPYSYLVPSDMTLAPGIRVCVPFGRANRKTEGMVLTVEEGDPAELKPVLEALDQTPVLWRPLSGSDISVPFTTPSAPCCPPVSGSKARRRSLLRNRRKTGRSG